MYDQQFHDELCAMFTEDQEEVKAYSSTYGLNPDTPEARKAAAQLTKNCRKRATRALEILAAIDAPTISTLGHDGSQALSVIALHSSLSTMQRVLEAFQDCYDEDPSTVDHEVIPPLCDRILILKGKKQRFGTQWLLGRDGTFFLYPVENFLDMSLQRKKYGLEPARYPVDLSRGSLLNKKRRLAVATDQRSPSAEEYDEYVREYLD